MPKFIAMNLLMFFILINLNLLNIIKNSFIVTLIGPEVISFVKLWIEMPLGLFFVLIYIKLCNIMSTEKVFRLIVSCFLLFFIFFAFIIFPYRYLLNPSFTTVQYYCKIFPYFFRFVVMWSEWGVVLFYVMAEFWAVIIFCLLFWQLANKIIHTEEASRFYAFFNIFGQTNLLISGGIVSYLSNGNYFGLTLFGDSNNDPVIMLKCLILLVTVFGILLLCIHKYIDVSIVSKKYIICADSNFSTLKLNFTDSLKMMINSKYLGMICIIVLAYSFSITLIEGVWMSKAKQLYPTINEFMFYYGNVLFWTGWCSLICAILGGVIIRKLGWFAGSIVTPSVMIVSGLVFLLLVLLEKYLFFLNLPAMTLIVYVGGLQYIVSKSMKYTIFDVVKEMAYIPLDNEMKTKGKAAIEIIGAKFGQSLSSILQFLSFSLFPTSTYDDIVGFILVIFAIVGIIWILSTKSLAKKYYQLL